MQPEYPISKLLKWPAKVHQTSDELVVSIVMEIAPIVQHSQLVTGCFFELVVLYGDATTAHGLRTDSEVSRLYVINETSETACDLRMLLPNKPWVALLKVSCLEGDGICTKKLRDEGGGGRVRQKCKMGNCQ